MGNLFDFTWSISQVNLAPFFLCPWVSVKMKRTELSELELPTMREELLSYMGGLSDANYQYRAWVEHSLPESGYDKLDYTVHFLYDDTGLAKDPYAWIGVVLRNTEEASSMAALVSAIDVVFDKYGVDLSDKDYLEKKEWQLVVDKAKSALEVLLCDGKG